MKILEFQNMTNDVVLIRKEVFVEEQHFCDEFYVCYPIAHR